MNTKIQMNIGTFLSEFLTPPKGNTPEANLAKAQLWLGILHSPQEHFPHANEFELRCRRRNARQNLRRLLTKHPEIVGLLKEEQ